MTRTMAPGEVAVVAGTSWTAKLIELGAVLRGEPAASHIAVAHHTDDAGRLWGIEGRPGGVGWIDMSLYLNTRRTVTNAGQPLTSHQRQVITATMVRLLGTRYDWLGGIAADAADVAGLPVNWAANDPVTGTLPGHVVCSSSAAFAYDLAGADNPGLAHHPNPAARTEAAGRVAAGKMSGGEAAGVWERVTPGDWAQFIVGRGWAR